MYLTVSFKVTALDCTVHQRLCDKMSDPLEIRMYAVVLVFELVFGHYNWGVSSGCTNSFLC